MGDWTSSDGAVSLLLGDCLERMADIPDGSVDCIVTSPPYWGLRSYKHDGAWGLESDWREWVRRMLAWGAEAKRVLKPTGTLWLNCGDCYFGDSPGRSKAGEAFHKEWDRSQTRSRGGNRRSATRAGGMRAKDLMLLPSRLAVAFHDELGFWVRNDCIWAKSNHMPSSVKDRLANSYEHLFLMTKSPRYFFALDRVRRATADIGTTESGVKAGPLIGAHGSSGHDGQGMRMEKVYNNPNGANPGDVLEGPTASYKGAHFAVYPEYLVEFCLKAGAPAQVCVTCGKPRMAIEEKAATGRRRSDDGHPRYIPGYALREKRSPWQEGVNYQTVGYTTCPCGDGYEPGTVLDPFLGSGTTAAVAARMGLRCIGIDVSADYLAMAQGRVERAILEREYGTEGADAIEAGQGALW